MASAAAPRPSDAFSRHVGFDSPDRAQFPALARFNCVAQRTAAWFALRRSAAMTGSKLSQLFFIKDQDEFTDYQAIIRGSKKAPPIDAEGLARCRFGTEHEDDGVTSLLHHFPALRTIEVGFKKHAVHAWMGSSPDGLVSWPERFGDQLGCLEVKCCTKTNKDGLTVPHKDVPYYYLLQVYYEMRCCETEWTVFVSWGQTGTHAWLIHFDPSLWADIFELTAEFYHAQMPYEHYAELQRSLLMRCRALAPTFEKLHGDAPLPSFCKIK